ncbi:hypothetical protein F5Y18DRAFT_442537 [Xylariaceae sp. FL1019]|nr:hypothetical protein F5Y18DRAFT_442537 [Xylariaceae sp. FL1019]
MSSEASTGSTEASGSISSLDSAAAAAEAAAQAEAAAKEEAEFQARLQEKLQEVQTHFAPQHERFRVDGIISNGAYGVTLRVLEMGPDMPVVEPDPVDQPRTRGVKRLRELSARSWGTIRKRLRISNSGDRNNDGVGGGGIGEALYEGSPERMGTRVVRRMCLKLPLGARTLGDSQDALRHEINILRSVNGSKHVAGLIAYRDDPLYVAFRLRGLPFPRVPSGQGDFLAGWSGPAVMIEWYLGSFLGRTTTVQEWSKLTCYCVSDLENGTLKRLIQRLEASDTQVVPNRVLWSIYLCLIRACVALLYPKALDPDADAELEVLPQPGARASGITHNDLGSANVMIGDLDPSHREHSLLPVVKLIDFGCSEDDQTPEDAASTNLADVSTLIMNLIQRSDAMSLAGQAEWQGIRTTARPLVPYFNMREDGPVHGVPYPHLDGEIRDLVCRAKAVDWDQRTALAEAYAIATRCINKGEGSFFLSGTAESDIDIGQFVQEFIFNPA